MSRDDLKAAQRELFEAGEYFAVSATLAPAAALVDAVEISVGARVPTTETSRSRRRGAART